VSVTLAGLIFYNCSAFRKAVFSDSSVCASFKFLADSLSSYKVVLIKEALSATAVLFEEKSTIFWLTSVRVRVRSVISMM